MVAMFVPLIVLFDGSLMVFEGLCQQVYHVCCVRFHTSSIAEEYAIYCDVFPFLLAGVSSFVVPFFVSSYKHIEPASSFLLFHVLSVACRSATFVL